MMAGCHCLAHKVIQQLPNGCGVKEQMSGKPGNIVTGQLPVSVALATS